MVPTSVPTTAESSSGQHCFHLSQDWFCSWGASRYSWSLRRLLLNSHFLGSPGKTSLGLGILLLRTQLPQEPGRKGRKLTRPNTSHQLSVSRLPPGEEGQAGEEERTVGRGSLSSGPSGCASFPPPSACRLPRPAHPGALTEAERPSSFLRPHRLCRHPRRRGRPTLAFSPGSNGSAKQRSAL